MSTFNHFWCSMGLLLLSALGISDALEGCGYRQKLEPGKRHGLVSPDYPDNYPTTANCRWNFASDTRVRLTCDEFNIVPSPNCQSDFLEVFTNPASPALVFCGRRSFSLESDDKEMIMTLNTAANTPGGAFSCFVEAIEEEKCTCGWKDPLQSRIVGGDEAGENEYPMMAVIFDVSLDRVRCGATIISNKHLLTAAHCVYKRTVNDIKVIVGAHDLTQGVEATASKDYQVARYDIHPSSNGSSSSDYNYDIAVITIDGTITFSEQVGSVCLPFKHSRDSFEGLNVDILGWGSKEFAGSTSNILQQASLNVENLTACKTKYPETEVNDRHICTYDEGKDSCQFDSGGPVLWQNPATGRLVHVGIISFGKACASNSPGVNTRVGPYLDWIRQVTDGVQYCQAE